MAAASNEGESVLHVVPGSYTDPEVVEVLLARNCDANAQNFDGETPLHLAVKLGDQDTASLLLNSGADPNAKTKSGTMPLDLAKKDELKWLLRSHKAKKSSA